MTPRKAFFAVCLIVSVLCLAAGYAIAGQWVGVGIAILIGPAWLLARKYPNSGLPHTCLLVYVCMVVIGQLTGAPPLLMICSLGIALAVWDLLLLDAALGSAPAEEQTRQYEHKHLRSLALALGSGLFLASLGRLVTLQIPFVFLVLLVALAVFSLDRAWNHIKKRRIVS